MTPTMKDLGIDRLTPGERLALIGEIWDSLSEDQVPLTDAQREELERRADDDDANPDDVVPWEEVRAAAQARCAE